MTATHAAVNSIERSAKAVNTAHDGCACSLYPTGTTFGTTHSASP
jgi:hypothetical protein